MLRPALLIHVAVCILPNMVGQPLIAADAPPNIVFFMADDQRNDTLGCAGHPILQTPHIDELAARGVRFRNAFVSHSICWVSRTTILSGLTARTFGEDLEPDRAKASALNELCPDLLRDAGYQVGFFGKWHAKTPRDFQPAQHFDRFQPVSRNPYHKIQSDGTLRHESQLVGDRVIQFLQERKTDKPFFVYAWFNAGHAEDSDRRAGPGHFPWPQVVDDLYRDIPEIPAPRLGNPVVFESQQDHFKQSINRQRFFWRWDTAEKYQKNIRAYFRMLSGVDHVVGRVRSELAAQGLDDNTIIVYCADNGYYMGDRGFAGKWSHYEQSLRIPMIIYDPRQPTDGTVCDELALNLDLPSTFLDYAGVRVPRSYQGHSLRPLVEGKDVTNWRDEFFCEHLFLAPTLTWEGVRGQRFVYARYFDQNPVVEYLHDLEQDPDQLINLVDVPQMKTTLQEMRNKCDDWVAKYGGPILPLDQRKP